MGKFVGAVIAVVQIGVGIVTGNPALIAAGVASLAQTAIALAFPPNVPKPDAATSQVKQPSPLRMKGYGTRRGFGSIMLFDTSKGQELLLGFTEPDSAIDVIAFFDGRSHAMRQAYLNDDKVTITAGVVQGMTDGRYSGSNIRAGFNLGLATETAFAEVVDRMPGIWTNDHRGDGITSGYLIKRQVKADDFLKVYPQGDNTTLSAVFDLQYCFDPRDPTQDAYDPDTWIKPTPLLDNPVLCLLHYLLTDRGIDYDTQILPVLDYWIDAADHCDEPVPLKAGGTERRYRCCVIYDSAAEPGGVIMEILNTFDGWYAPNELGQMIVYSGRFYTPTVTIGPEQIIDHRHQAFVEEEDVVNELSLTYISNLHDYAAVDTTPWADDADIAERGRLLTSRFEPQIPSHGQARRLAKRKMSRNNAQDRGTITTNFSGQAAMGQRFIMLNEVEAGATFYSGPAEITAIERNMQTGGVSFDWVKADPNADAWNPATEEGEPAPVGARVPQEATAAPTILDASAQLAGDGVSAQILIDVEGPGSTDLTWFARWRITGDAVWIEQGYSDIDPGDEVMLLVGLVPVNASIEVQAAYKLGDGRVSDWSTTVTESTTTAALAPASPTEVGATGGVGSASVTWRNPTTTNLSYVKVFRNTANDFGTASVITGEIVGGLGEVMSINDTGLSPDDYWWWVVAYNVADIASAPGGPATATVT